MLLMALGLVSAVVLAAAGCSGAGKSTLSAGQGGSSQAYGGKGQAQKATTGESRAASVEKLGHPVLGDKNAPVTMIEYGDYQ